MAALSSGTKTILDATGGNVVVKTGVDSGDSTTSPAHAIIDAATGALLNFDSVFANTRPPRLTSGVSFNRPADTTAYTAGDLVANSTTAGSVTALTIPAARANDIPAEIIQATLKKSGTTPTNAIFRVHFFGASPGVANGDNGVFTPSTFALYFGAIDVTLGLPSSVGCVGIGVATQGATVPFVPASGTQNIFALIECRAAYTPVSGETFTLEVGVR